MVDENQGPAGGLTPHLTIGHKRAKDAIAFYKSAFAAIEAQPPHLAEDKERIMHAHLRINGGSLMLNDDFPEYTGHDVGQPAATTLHLQVEDADEWWKRALDAGATARMELADQFWGDRYGQIDDPFGFTWSIGAPVKKDLVNRLKRPGRAIRPSNDLESAPLVGGDDTGKPGRTGSVRPSDVEVDVGVGEGHLDFASGK